MLANYTVLIISIFLSGCMFFHRTWQVCNYVVYVVLSRILMYYRLFNYA